MCKGLFFKKQTWTSRTIPNWFPLGESVYFDPGSNELCQFGFKHIPIILVLSNVMAKASSKFIIDLLVFWGRMLQEGGYLTFQYLKPTIL